MNLLIAPSINSTDLSASKFCKILVVNLFPVKIKQLPKVGRVKHFVKNWQKLTDDPMILDIVRGYEIPFILLPKGNQSYQICVNQRSVRPSGSGGPRYVEEGCCSSFGSQRGPISQLVTIP